MALASPAGRTLLLDAFSGPRSIRGLQFYTDDTSPITRTAGMATAFAALSLQHLSRAGSATLWGDAAGWWRSGHFLNTDTGVLKSLNACLASNTGYEVQSLATNVLRLYAGTGAATVNADSLVALGAATWYHYYIEFDGDKFGISVNNETLVQTAGGQTYSPGVQAWNVGRSIGGTANYHNGNISALYGGNGVLTTAQRTALYNSGTGLAYDQVLAQGIVPLFAYSLNEPSGDRVDQVGGLNLTATNTPGTAAGVVQNVVSQWNDLSGLNNHATQATQANQPEILARAQNGRRGLHTDGVNDFLSVANLTLSAFCTVIVVGKSPSSALLLEHGPNAASNDGFFFWGTSNTAWAVRRTTLNAVVGTASWMGTSPAIVAMIYHGTGDGGNYYKNGTVQANTTPSGALLANTNTTNTLYIGSRAGVSIFSNGDWDAILIYNGALTDREFRLLNKWASQRFNIALTG